MLNAICYLKKAVRKMDKVIQKEAADADKRDYSQMSKIK